jgi:hypothetical protein
MLLFQTPYSKNHIKLQNPHIKIEFSKNNEQLLQIFHRKSQQQRLQQTKFK